MKLTLEKNVYTLLVNVCYATETEKIEWSKKQFLYKIKILRNGKNEQKI